uniref:Uncharacterized protein n=1 Tax=Lepeophtheirus salmonis TaxID=72036 RepID=A0A0K2V2Z1_LEPSM
MPPPNKTLEDLTNFKFALTANVDVHILVCLKLPILIRGKNERQ